MGPAQLLDRIKRIITGNGFRTVRDINIREFHLDSDGATLTTTLSTNPGWDKFDTNLTTLSWAAGKFVAAGIDIRVPDDYDSTNDVCKLRLKAVMTGATDTPYIAAAAYIDDDATTDLSPSNTADLSDTSAWVEIDLDGNSLTAGDVVHVILTPEDAHDTDAIHILATKLEYRTCLCAYSDTNR